MIFWQSPSAALPVAGQVAYVAVGVVVLRVAYVVGSSMRLVSVLGTAFLVLLIWLQHRAAVGPNRQVLRDSSQMNGAIIGFSLSILLATLILAYLAGQAADKGWESIVIFIGVMVAADYVVRAGGRTPLR